MSSETATATGSHYDLAESAKPVAVATHSGDIWFVTPDARIGRFAPRDSFGSKVYKPEYLGGPRSARSLTAWNKAVWTYAHNADDGRTAKCDGNGKYPPLGKGQGFACPAMVVGKKKSGNERLVATLEGQRKLMFVDGKGEVSTSGTGYSAALFGVAVNPKNAEEYWVSCPSKKELVKFDAQSGSFSTNPVIVNETPGHLVLTHSQGKLLLWAAAEKKNQIIRCDLTEDGSYTAVDTSSPAGRLFALDDGAVWFTMPSAGAVGYIPPNGKEVQLEIPTGQGTKPSGIALDTKGQLWVGLEGTGQMFRVSEHQLRPLSGEGQQVSIGEKFPQPLKVKAAKLGGSGVKGVSVTFTIEGGRAEFVTGSSTDTQTTGDDGTATSARFRALAAGPCAISATWTDKGITVPFKNIRVKEEVGPADHVRYLSGGGQTAEPEEDFDEPLKVVVEDAKGTPVKQGTTVAFRVMDDSALFGESPVAEAISGKGGVATSPTLTAGSETGRFKVEAWVRNGSAGTVFREFIKASES
ncbi:hypothetical protein ABZ419_09115 [Streptomyces cinnamoneus]|uniref:hypothetical protein n=1 Tax=Streptomyces cinnamoneus TaxID=53446 RepID=UPI00340219CA